MADNITLPGTGSIVASKEKTASRHVQYMFIDGGSGATVDPFFKGAKTSDNSFPVVQASDSAPRIIASGQMDMSDTWASRFPENLKRVYLEIQMMDSSPVDCWFGEVGKDDTSSYRLPGVDMASVRFSGTFELFGQSTSGTPRICWYEVSNP